MVLYPNKLPESERVCSGICTPELVLTGNFVEKDNTFLFSKGSYQYVVTMDHKATLKVQHNGRAILQQTQETKEF